MKRFPLRVTAILMFLLCSQAIFGLLHPGISELSLDSPTDLSPATIIVTLLIYGMVAGSLLFYWRHLPGILVNARLVLGLPLLALVSVAWSQDPSLSLRRAAVLLVVSCVGAYFGSVFTLQELSKLVTATAFVICVTTVILAVVAPGIVMDPVRAGTLKGIFTHKNAQGTFMSLALVSALHSRFNRWQWMKYATIVMATALMLLSHSSTALVAVLAVLALLPFWRLARVPMKQIIVTGAVVGVLVCVTVFLVSTYSEELFHLLGKNSTLTGRTELWTLILQSVSRRPLLGYGYNGFWLGLQGESLTISAASGWVVFHAHNGLLDVLLGLGVVGTALFLATLGRMVAMIASYTRASGARMESLWPASFLVALTVINSTESLLLSANSIFWLLYVAVYANMARHSRSIALKPSTVPAKSELTDVGSIVPLAS